MATDPSHPSSEPPPTRGEPSPPSSGTSEYEEGKRAGAHPLIVLFGVIIGLWLLLSVFMPSPKTHMVTNPDLTTDPTPMSHGEDAPVMFRIGSTLADIHAISIVVPPEATESQVVSLLIRFKEARRNRALSEMLPPTTPGHQLGDHAVARIYVVSNAAYAAPDAIRVLARGAHAPGHLYPTSIPFEEIMEHIRGYYSVNLTDAGQPETASLGFADQSGVHSRHYRKLF